MARDRRCWYCRTLSASNQRHHSIEQDSRRQRHPSPTARRRLPFSFFEYARVTRLLLVLICECAIDSVSNPILISAKHWASQLGHTVRMVRRIEHVQLVKAVSREAESRKQLHASRIRPIGGMRSLADNHNLAKYSARGATLSN